MIRYIDEHKDRFGVEPIVAVLRDSDAGFLSVSGYYAAKTRPPSARAVRDAALTTRIAQIHAENYGVYGVRKMHAAARRDGLDVGRDQVGRLMRDLGLHGVRRGRPHRTTRPDPAAEQARDQVQRRFRAERPNQLWVCDLTYIRTWAGFAYLALVIDVYSRRIVGWAVTGHMRTELPLEALEHAIWHRQHREKHSVAGLIAHSDRGAQYTAIRYTDRLAEAEAIPSVGSVGDSYDNALAESTIGQIKTELINRLGPWRTLDQLELALFTYLDWWNHRRLHSEINMASPAEHEAAYYRHTQPLAATPATTGTQ